MDQYNPERVHTRVAYIQYIYKNEIYPEAFDNFVLPIAVYDRNGIIAKANDTFRKLTGIRSDDIQNGAVNIYTRMNENNAGLLETARNAFDGRESVYIGSGCLIKTENNPNEYQLSRHPNAIFFPMTYDRDGITLAGILLDENKTDTEKLNL